MRAEGQNDKKGKTDSVGEDRIEKEEKKNGINEEEEDKKREEEKDSGEKEEKKKEEKESREKGERKEKKEREEKEEKREEEKKREGKQKAEKKRKPIYHLCYFGLVAVLVFLDQLVKEELRGGFPSKTLLPGVLGLTYAENRGMAFGLAQGKGGFLLLFTVFALVLLFYLYLIQKGTRGFLYWAREVGILLTMAGAVGNALDRFFFGYVVDYLEFLFVDFPIFNLADCFVVSGVVFLALGLLGEKEGER
ncbi:MAG: signal peptidase II [Blautia sp.]|nr:signal peptidase II [Blautia sp.]